MRNIGESKTCSGNRMDFVEWKNSGNEEAEQGGHEVVKILLELGNGIPMLAGWARGTVV